jgi:hypothetical protein
MPNYNLWPGISSSLGLQGEEGNCVQLEVGPKFAEIRSVNCSLKQQFTCEVKQQLKKCLISYKTAFKIFGESNSASKCEASQCLYSVSEEEVQLQ